MSKTLGDKEHFAVVGREFHGEILFKSRRVLAQVDDDVINGSRGATNKLGLGKWRDLKVHATQCAFALVQRDVALFHVRIDAMRLKFLSAKCAGEKPAAVCVRFQVNDERAG